MFLAYNDHSAKSGIYKIINKYSNRIYIGQAKRFKDRWSDHASLLRHNKHCNKFLQNDFNKSFQELQHDNFLEFHILEIMENSTKEERNAIEEKYISENFDHQNMCYNIFEKVNDKERIFSQSTPELLKLRSNNAKSLWKDETYRENQMKIRTSPEFREAAKENSKQIWIDNPDFVQKMSDKAKQERIDDPNYQLNLVTKSALARAISFKVVNEVGEVFEGSSANDFCEQQNISRTAFVDMLKGRYKQSNGFRLPETTLESIKNAESKIAKTYTFLSPTDELITITNITKFCRENPGELKTSALIQVAIGNALIYKGWRLPKNKDYVQKHTSIDHSSLILLSPSGETFTGITNMSQFSKTHNLHKDAIQHVLSGKRKQHKGWTLVR